MEIKGIRFSGKKVTSRPPLVYAAAAGLATFVILAYLSTAAAGGSGPDKKPEARISIPRNTSSDSLSTARGRRAYAIKTIPDDGTLELVKEGSTLDVIVSFPMGPSGTPLTRTVIGGARLLKFNASKRLAVIEVTPEEAERLAFSEANGQIRLSVCPPGPDAAVPGQGATFEDI